MDDDDALAQASTSASLTAFAAHLNPFKRDSASASPQRALSTVRTISKKRSASALEESNESAAGSKTPVKREGRYKKGIKKVYAEPSKYAHLEPLPHRLEHDLDIIWCGIKYALPLLFRKTVLTIWQSRRVQCDERSRVCEPNKSILEVHASRRHHEREAKARS